jgi:peptidoglycan/LPS O-acetylase OafA/YrhL
VNKSHAAAEPSGSRPDNLGKRISELDGVRGTAILMVLSFHLFAYTMLFRGVPQARWTWLEYLVARITEKGAYGVDLFLFFRDS